MTGGERKGVGRGKEGWVGEEGWRGGGGRGGRGGGGRDGRGEREGEGKELEVLTALQAMVVVLHKRVQPIHTSHSSPPSLHTPNTLTQSLV